MLYFAYCTLMDVEGMRAYCPSAQPDGLVYLQDATLAFAAYSPDGTRGGCTYHTQPGARLYGLLFDVPDEELNSLSRKSGVAEGWYAMVPVSLVRLDGRPIDAFTLIIPDEKGPFRPSANYIAPIVRGARQINLPLSYQAELESLIAAVLA